MEVKDIVATAEVEGLAAARASGWQALARLDDDSDLDPLVQELAWLADSFPPSADLTILRGAT